MRTRSPQAREEAARTRDVQCLRRFPPCGLEQGRRIEGTLGHLTGHAREDVVRVQHARRGRALRGAYPTARHDERREACKCQEHGGERPRRGHEQTGRNGQREGHDT